MDSRPDTLAGDDTTIQCDQAVFTSMRSATGEGYRIVGASPGIIASEKIAITRTSPSHDSLCESRDDATGAVCYRLDSGRWCIGHCRYAGHEPSGRAGLRVYTHMVVLDDEAYRRFGRNPFRVRRALRRAVGMQEDDPPSGRLTPAILDVADDFDDDTVSEPILGLLEALLAGGEVIVVGVDSIGTMLDLAIEAMPLSMRGLALSVGVKVSSSRKFKMVAVDQDRVGLMRATRGRGIAVVDAADLAPSKTSAFAGWIGLVRRWGKQFRFDEIRELTAMMNTAVVPADLDRIAGICHDIDQANDADADELEVLRRRHQTRPGSTFAEKHLLDRLGATIAERTALLSVTP